jgi:predicted CXXCH cytochrome family protein
VRKFPKMPAAMLLLALGIFVANAYAGKHPVPLDPNTDPAKCIECHEDKAKGPFVHTAISMGCLSCHEIRVIKSREKNREDVTRVKLIKATATSQCLSCHDDMKKSAGNSVVHAPVTRNCLTCHDPHVSANKYQLKKPEAGGRNENLCLECHNQGLNVPQKGSRHAALDAGCDTCHVTHKTGSADKRDNRYHLTKDAPALCLDCHDAKDAQFAEAHHNQPVATADCLTCHDPHQSDKPKLAQRFEHAPFEAGSCDTCHQPAKDGKVVLTNSDTRALCITCHDEEAQRIEKAKIQHPGAQGECIACHSPHASASPYLLTPDPVKACENCHAEQAEMQKTKAVLHPPAFRDGCYVCHDGHGGDRPNLLRADGNRLCLECHSPNRKPTVLKDQDAVAIFGGGVLLPAYYFNRMPALDLRAGDMLGHPTASHPVSATVDRSDPDKKRAMTCLTCHTAHAGAARNMLVTETASSMSLCSRCHAGTIGSGMPDEASSTVSPSTATKAPAKGKGKTK